MANANEIITYWKHNSTGMIYKYYGHTKPYCVENYTQVTGWDYDQQLEYYAKKFAEKA